MDMEGGEVLMTPPTKWGKVYAPHKLVIINCGRGPATLWNLLNYYFTQYYIISVGVLETSKMFYCWAGIELAPSVPWLVTILTEPR